jgi:hypothetical protein
VFFADFHAHHGVKNMFVYGNYLNFTMQVESKVFTKCLSLNNKYFCYDSCNFSKKHMKCKDMGSALTKEGSARVAAYRKSNLPHSYTLEFGYHQNIEKDDYFGNTTPTHFDPIKADLEKSNQTQPRPTKASFRKKDAVNEKDPNNDSKSLDQPENSLENQKIDINPYGYGVIYTPEIFELVGADFVATLLDLFNMNPDNFPKVPGKVNIEDIRSAIAHELRDEYKKKEMNIDSKIANINDIVKTTSYMKIVGEILKKVQQQEKDRNKPKPKDLGKDSSRKAKGRDGSLPAKSGNKKRDGGDYSAPPGEKGMISTGFQHNLNKKCDATKMNLNRRIKT